MPKPGHWDLVQILREQGSRQSWSVSLVSLTLFRRWTCGALGQVVLTTVVPNVFIRFLQGANCSMQRLHGGHGLVKLHSGTFGKRSQ